jgi:phage shock protein A
MLIAQHRRARIAGKANAARTLATSHERSNVLNRLRTTIQRNEATITSNYMILEAQSLEDQLNRLEKEDRIERLLEDLKSRQPRFT